MKAKPAAKNVDQRLAQLEKALQHFSEGLWRVSNELALHRPSKHNPERLALEKRVLELENKFFAFQCGAQAQMDRDRQAMERDLRAAEEERIQAIRETLGARGAN